MDGNGIMDEIRGLLSQGISAPEIARQGYASSTVYRVQRDLRRKLGRLGSSGSSVPGWDDWVKLEAENQQLNQRIESLERQLAATSPVVELVDKLEAKLEEVAVQQKQQRQDMAAVEALVGKIDGELDDLAKLHKDDVLFGIGEPKWQRRPG